MNLLHDAFLWLNDPLNWQGPKGVPHLTYEHLYISFFAVFFGCRGRACRWRWGSATPDAAAVSRSP